MSTNDHSKDTKRALRLFETSARDIQQVERAASVENAVAIHRVADQLKRLVDVLQADVGK